MSTESVFEINRIYESLVIWRENSSKYNSIDYYIQLSIESDTNGDPVVALLDAKGVFNRLADGLFESITSSLIVTSFKYGVWARKSGNKTLMII